MESQDLHEAHMNKSQSTEMFQILLRITNVYQLLMTHQDSEDLSLIH